MLKRDGPLIGITFFLATVVAFRFYLQWRLERHDPGEVFKYFANRSKIPFEEIMEFHNDLVHTYRAELLPFFGSSMFALCLLWSEIIPICLIRIMYIKHDFFKAVFMISAFVFFDCISRGMEVLILDGTIDFLSFSKIYGREIVIKVISGAMIFSAFALFGRLAFLLAPLTGLFIYCVCFFFSLKPFVSRFVPMDWTSEIGQKIASLFDKTGFPKSNFFVDNVGFIHAPSDYFGLFSSASDSVIVIKDLFLHEFPSEEILGAIAHELGHWVDGFGLKYPFVNFVFALMTLLGFSVFFSRKNLTKSLGFTWKNTKDEPNRTGLLYRLMPDKIFPLHATLIAILFFDHLIWLLTCIQNLTGQSGEFKADAFAASHGLHHEFSTFLIKGTSVMNASLDPLFESFMLSQTCVERRVKKLLGLTTLSL